MSTSPFPRVLEPGDFDSHAARPPILEGMSTEVWGKMSIAEKMRRLMIAWGEVKEIHQKWYRERYPDACDVEVWGDWLRVMECSPILAKAMRDAAEREADQPYIVEVTSN